MYRRPSHRSRTLLAVGYVLGCLVGFAGCSNLSATVEHHAQRPTADRRERRSSRKSAAQRCAPARCRRFAIAGDSPIPDTTADAGSDQARSDPADDSCVGARQRRAVDEAQEVAEGALLLSAPDGAALMRHFLGGSGTPVSFGPTSRVAALIAGSGPFKLTTRRVETELKKQLVPLAASHRRAPATRLRLDPGFLVAIRPDFDSLSQDPDLYLSFRGTQGMLVRGAGRVVPAARDDQSARATGTLTYTISDIYGFDSDTPLRVLGHAFGPDLHYLQTSCGAPAHEHGAHWFRDSATVVTHFRFSLS